MENLSLMLLLSIIIPMIMALFIFDKRSKTNMIFMMLGIVSCFFCGEINGLLYNVMPLGMQDFTVNVTPVVEEIAKAYPIFLYAFLFKPSKKKIYESAIIIGIGFSILENSYMIANNSENVSLMLALVRGFGAGMMHGITTFAVGFGITFIYTKRKLFIAGSFAMMCVAITYHSIYNDLVQSSYSMAGFIMPVITFIAMMVINKLKKLEIVGKSVSEEMNP